MPKMYGDLRSKIGVMIDNTVLLRTHAQKQLSCMLVCVIRHKGWTGTLQMKQQQQHRHVHKCKNAGR